MDIDELLNEISEPKEGFKTVGSGEKNQQNSRVRIISALELQEKEAKERKL